jgi:hypothetical protein
MQIDKNNIIERINYLIDLATKAVPQWDHSACNEVASGTIAILEYLYGANSHKTKAFLEQHVACCKDKDSPRPFVGLAGSAKGVLCSIKSEVEAGLVGNIQLQAQAGIFGDFITAARRALEEDSKDVAAVLTCAALEDALKRYAEQQGLDVSDADMSQVINALKSKGVLREPQATIVKSYVKLRDKAFHAEWDKVEKESVNSAIGFTEQFILSNFS